VSATETASPTVVTVGRDDILGPFGTVAGMAAKKHHIEAFKWVHFICEEGQDEGYFEASNGQSSIRVALTGQEAGGSLDVYLPTRLGNVIKSMPQGPVQLEIGNGKVAVHGTGEGDARFELALLAVSPNEKPTISLGLDQDWSTRPLVEGEMIEALGAASRFASNDTARQNLMSVLVKQKEDETVISSSDSYRMFVERRILQFDLQEAGSFSVPKAAIGALAAFGGMKMGWDDNRVYLSDGADVHFATQRIHGDVPDFEAMVDRIAGTEGQDFPIPREALQVALGQVGVLAGSDANTVVLTFDPLNIGVSLRSGEDLATAHVLTETPFDNDERAAYNIGFLREGLGLFSESEIDLHYVNPNRPIVMSTQDGARRYMLAAVRLV
jgi:DNA polymerase III sliding clamp (beta) subunit (PCNA family)